MARCEVCGAPEAPLRRCTRQRLCQPCRALPDYKVVTLGELRKKGLELTSEDLLPLRAGLTANPVNRRFARMGVYYWKDVALLCISRGLDLD
jgi:hypothetical protein